MASLYGWLGRREMVGSRTHPLCLALALAACAAVLAAPGCGSKPANQSAGTTTQETTGQMGASASSIATSVPPTSSAAATNSATSGTVTGKTTPKPTVKLGPLNAATSWAYLKDMYEKDGFWYVVVDYVQVVGPEESLQFKNTNPLLRTFPLSSKAKLLLLTGAGGPDYAAVSVAKFKASQARPGDEIVEVTPKNGYVVQLKEWWAP
jgi:hypothetical protein